MHLLKKGKQWFYVAETSCSTQVIKAKYLMLTNGRCDLWLATLLVAMDFAERVGTLPKLRFFGEFAVDM